MSTEQNWLTAVHEAGHAAAYMLFAELTPESFDYVTIEPGEDSAGHVQIIQRDGMQMPDGFRFYETNDENLEAAGFTHAELEARLCILLAGEAAICLEAGERDGSGSGRETWDGDYADCMEYMQRLFPVGDDPDAAANKAAETYMEALFWRTVCILQGAWWGNVTAIARALVDRRTLTMTECREVVARTP